METWAGIIRVSHMGQRKAGAENVHTDREQLEAIERHAAQHGARLEVLPAELNVSGGLPLVERPSLLRAVEGVEDGTYDAIIAAYQSRLGRDTHELLGLWQRVEKAGGRIISVREGLDTSKPEGRLQRTIMSGIDQHQREVHAERFEQRRAEATAAGIWQRRQTPLGYRRDEATRRLVPDRRADQVRWAFRSRAAGESITAVARRLRMTPSGIRQLLKNRVYLGELTVGQHLNERAHEPLVTLEEFEAAQRTVARPARAGGPPSLLAGLVVCASCGHRMTRSHSGARAVYRCPTYHSGERCPAPATITVDLLDKYVERIARAELERLSVTTRPGRGVERARVRLAEAERALAAFLDAVDAAGLGVEDAASGIRKRRDARDAAKAELRGELARRPELPETGTGAEAYERLDTGERNHVLRSLLACVLVAPAGGRGVRRPVAARVRVLAFGADIGLPARRGGEASGVVPIKLPDLDDKRVLGVPAGEQ